MAGCTQRLGGGTWGRRCCHPGPAPWNWVPEIFLATEILHNVVMLLLFGIVVGPFGLSRIPEAVNCASNVLVPAQNGANVAENDVSPE